MRWAALSQKDKTFFFVDYQGKRQRRGVPFTGLFPTKAMIDAPLRLTGGDYTLDPFGVARPGFAVGAAYGDKCRQFRQHLQSVHIFVHSNATVRVTQFPRSGGVQTGGSPCNKIPSNMIDPTGQKILELYPQSNASNPALGFNFTNTPVRSINEGEFDVRLDHQFSTKDSAFARFSYDQAVSFVPGGSPPGFAEPTPSPVQKTSRTTAGTLPFLRPTYSPIAP